MSRRLIILMLAVVALVQQACDTESNIDKPKDFYKLIGSDGSQTGVDMVQDAEGRLYILGTSTSKSNGTQNYLVMTNIRGEVQWESVFGTPGNDDPKDLELLRDGKLAIVSNIINDTGKPDFRIYRIDPADGKVLATSGSVVETENSVATSVTQFSDGGFAVTATVDYGTYKQARAFRYTSDLEMFPPTWQPQFASLQDSGGYDIIPVKMFQISDNQFYTFCYSNAPDGTDLINDYNYLVIVSNEFNDPAAGAKFFIGTSNPNSNERLTSVMEYNAGIAAGYTMVGYTTNPATNLQELYVVRTRAVLTLGQDVVTVSRNIPTNGVAPTSNTNAIAGASGSGIFVLANVVGDGTDIYLTKVSNGAQLSDLWSPKTYVTFGGINDDSVAAVLENSGGRILVCGTMGLGDLGGQTKIVLMNLSPNGKFGE